MRLRTLGPENSLQPHVYSTLFGLLASTGLRISEALDLWIENVTHEGIVVRNTKFGKSRLLPLHATTRAARELSLEASRHPGSALQRVSSDGARCPSADGSADDGVKHNPHRGDPACRVLRPTAGERCLFEGRPIVRGIAGAHAAKLRDQACSPPFLCDPMNDSNLTRGLAHSHRNRSVP